MWRGAAFHAGHIQEHHVQNILHTPVSTTILICAESKIPYMYGKHNSSEFFCEESCIWEHTF